MTALDRVQQLRTRIESNRNEKQFVEEADALAGLHQELQEKRHALEAIVAVAAVLVRNGAMNSHALPDESALTLKLESVTDAFDGTSKSLKKSQRLTSLLRLLEKTREGVSLAASETWVYDFREGPRVDIKLLNQIAKLPSQRSATRELREANDRYLAILKSPPTNQSQWEEYRALRQEIETRLTSFAPETFPPAALEFCIAAQAGGATLGQLTVEVREWLEERDMLNDIRLRFFDYG